MTTDRELLTVDSAPIGTLAPSCSGGAWCKTGRGKWKWNGPFGTGSAFPRPGGDWDGRLLPPTRAAAIGAAKGESNG